MIAATRFWPGLAMIGLAIALAGCSAGKTMRPPAIPPAVVAPPPAPPVATTPSLPAPSDQPLVAAESIVPGDSVYFAPGASDIDGDGMALLRRCADRLKADADQRVTLIGMTDDLGSLAYNVAIADRRIAEVYLVLRNMGVPAHRIQRRNVAGETARHRCAAESCRQLLRRVELRYGD